MKINFSQAIKGSSSFGVTSGIITTLGLIVGINASTHSKAAVIGSILTIAVADSFSDALGIHFSEESGNDDDTAVWEATIVTFLTKLLIPLTFIIPVLLFKLDTAIWVNIIWSFSILTILSYILAKHHRKDPKMAILEHLFITIVVIIITFYLGGWIENYFKI